MKKILMALVAMLLLATTANAIRPRRGLTPFRQADGTVIMVQKEGDKHLAFYVSEDGYVLKENAAGNLCYAVVKGEQLEASDMVAHSLNTRQQKELSFVSEKALKPNDEAVLNTSTFRQSMRMRKANYASTSDGLGKYGQSSLGACGTIGEYVIPVVMVQFKNLKFTKMTEAKLTRYLNEEGYHDESGCVGCVRDYFISQSRGMFKPRFEVVATVTLKNNYSTYGGNDSQGNDKGFNGNRPFVTEAIDSAVKKGVDFTQFTRNGKVPNVSFFYAGRGEATEGGYGPNYIWPHMDDLNTTFNDVYFNSYFVGNEIDGDGKLMGMGVFCHEFGHVLGLPDFYCTDYSHNTEPIGDWSIMDSGAYVNDARAPMGYTAYERSYMGWLNIPELSNASHVTLSKYDDQEGTPAVLIRNPSDQKEYFILENHQPGTWYPNKYGSGLLVMRVAYNQTAWDGNYLNNTASKMRCMLVSANGKTLTNGDTSSSAELWGNASDKKEITNFVLYNGKSLVKPIFSIAKNSNGTISFNFLKNKFNELEVGDTIRKDGICYVKTAEEELTVVSDPKNPYTGAVVVPAGFFEDETDFTVVAVGEGAFANQSDLQSVTLPATVRDIADDAFRHTPSLQAITVLEGSRYYMSSADGVLFNRNTYMNSPARIRRAAAEEYVTFDFAANPWNHATSNNSDGTPGYVTEPIDVDGVRMTTTNGNTKTRFWESNSGEVDLRVYSGGGSLTFTSTNGSTITKIEFTGTAISMNASEGTFENKIWTGESQSVTFTAAGTNKISKVVLTLESGDVPPVLIHYPAAGATEYAVPDGTTEICSYAFEGAGVETLTLPSTLYFIGDFALAAPNLKLLICNMLNLPDTSGDPFEGDTGYAGVDKEACEIQVPGDAEEMYREDEIWGPFFSSEPVNGIQSISSRPTIRGRVYDLQGRRVVKTAKGIYIMDGKKIIVK